MSLKTSTGVYKAITYKFLKGGEILIVVLPRASAEFSSHIKLVEDLSKFGSVLFIETGYFGVTKPNGNLNEIKIENFRVLLHELIISLGYAKTIIIGESVGGVHALNYASNYSDEVLLVVLSNPSLYRPRWLYRNLFVPVLRLSLRTSPDVLLKSLGKLLKLLPPEGSKQLGETFMRMDRSVGANSYLYCLKEIVDFSSKYQLDDIKKVLPKTHVIKGEKDKVFDLLCNSEYCKKCASFTEVPLAGHGIIDINPLQVIRLLQQLR